MANRGRGPTRPPIPARNAGSSHTNLVTVTGSDDEGTSVTDTDDATVTPYTNATPAITVVKTANPTSVTEGGVGGQSVTFTYVVTNTSTPAVPIR